MSSAFDSCAICSKSVPIVISQLMCCGKTCCLTCARNMFHLNKRSYTVDRMCSLCFRVIEEAPESAHLFYTVRKDLFSVVDSIGPLECPRGCNFSGNSLDIWRHIRNACNHATTSCTKCGMMVERSKLDTIHRESECKFARYCFCGRAYSLTMSGYKLHIDKHKQHARYTEMCDASETFRVEREAFRLMGAEMPSYDSLPAGSHMIRCGTRYSCTPDYITVAVGCNCYEIFTLAEFVAHVDSM